MSRRLRPGVRTFLRRMMGTVNGRKTAAAPAAAAPSEPAPVTTNAPVVSKPGKAGMQLRPVPERVLAAKRDPGNALQFLDNFEADAARMRGPAPASDSSELAKQVHSSAWYHTIELPGGIVTTGMFDHRPVVDHYGLPDDLTGKRCLDIACSDGFWSFELERRGGEVTAINVDSPADYDLPTGASVPERLTQRPLDCFSIAHRALGSRVTRVARSLYDLDPAELGTFDLVHSGDVLLHIERPLDGLRRYRAMTAEHGFALIADAIDPTLEANATRYAGGFEGHLWWLPSLDCLVQMVYDAGFGSVEVVSIYNLPSWDRAEGYWRAALKATP